MVVTNFNYLAFSCYAEILQMIDYRVLEVVYAGKETTEKSTRHETE